MQNKYIMAIDEGTTSTRALIFDHNGQKLIETKQAISHQMPQPGWFEQDPIEIWQTTQTVIADAIIKANIKPDQIISLGISNQRETTIVWDKKTGLPIYPAIGWQSQQSQEIVKQLKPHTDMIQAHTGLNLDAYFSATKIRFILDQVPGAQQRAQAGELLFGTVNTWLAWQLSDGEIFATDTSNASRTMLFNIHQLKWDQAILDLLDIPLQMLPAVKESAANYGQVKSHHFFGHPVTIGSMIGSQQAALFGQLAFEPGMVKSTYGTGAFIVMNIGTIPLFSEHKLLTSIGYTLNGKTYYVLEGSIFAAGSAIAWLHENLELLKSVSASDTLAKNSQNHDELYFVPAFSGLGAPYWDAQAKGTILGITRGTNAADLTKATLQAVAYQTKDILETMQQDTQINMGALKVDGAATQNDYLMQFQADILNTNVYRSANLETTALGAAFLAGLAVSFWENQTELQRIMSNHTVFSPKMSQQKRAQLYRGWQKAVATTRVF